jgi:hypothetical protein
MNDEVRGFSRSWARAVAAVVRVYDNAALTEAQADMLARLFHKERARRGWDWLPDETETDALVARARAAA